MSTIVTLAMDVTNQAHFDALRKEHYPAQLNQINAHLTLFHHLPETDEIRQVLQHEACSVAGFIMRVSGLMHLGRGVAYAIESAELNELHRRLSVAFAEHLIAQDKQSFRPHVVIQNKAGVDESKILASRLATAFIPWNMNAVGFEWWNYKGGPWQLRERFSFRKLSS